MDLQARLDQLAADIEPIQGWLHPEAGKVLYRVARFDAPVTTIVELGSWRGRSTAWLANAVRDRGGGRVYAVDTWQGTAGEDVHKDLLAGYEADELYQEFRANLEARRLLEFVEPLRADTASAVRAWPHERKIGLLFIDADHSYEAVRADFELWSPYVAPGGFVVFDDVAAFAGPARVVTELPKWYTLAAISPNQNIFIKDRR